MNRRPKTICALYSIRYLIAMGDLRPLPGVVCRHRLWPAGSRLYSLSLAGMFFPNRMDWENYKAMLTSDQTPFLF